MEVLNWSRLNESTGGDLQFAVELLEDYSDLLADELQSLAAAVPAGRYVEACSQAHALKGASASVGAESVREASANLESACRRKDEAGAAAALRALESSASGYFQWYEEWRSSLAA